jgi:hypothetical protein
MVSVDGKDKLDDSVITMLDDCVAWDGVEAKLPVGSIMPPGVDVLKLIKSYDVLDAESDEGFRTVKASELKPDDVIIGANANNKSIAKIVDTYGMDAFRFIAAGGQQYSLDKWIETFGTNPFEVLAIMKKNSGPSVPPFKIGGN